MMNLRQVLGDSRLLISGGLLLSAVLLGGGGAGAHASELALQLLAGISVIAWLALPRSGPPVRLDQASRWALLVLSLCAVLGPLMQLIPLPPSIWHHLPGRSGEIAALSLVGEEDSWRPLSLSPRRTLASLLSIVPAVIMVNMAARLGLLQRYYLLVLLLCAVILSIAVGAVQMASDGTALNFYSSSHAGYLLGFQANRNSQVDLLLCGLVLTGLVAGGAITAKDDRRDASYRIGVLAGLSALLVVAIILTGSRTGIFLLPIAALAQWLALRSGPAGQGAMRKAGRILPMLSVGLAILLGAVALVGKSAVLANIASRFDASQDFRTELWKDGWFAMVSYWPFGAGTGTVVPALVGAERLEVVDQTMPNRVHNDFLEWMLESGLLGLFALAAIGIVIVFLARRNWTLDNKARPMVLTGLAMIAIFALHSLVDYPLRSMSLAVVAAFAVALLCPSPRGLMAVEKD